MIGQQLGPYAIEAELGSGGMGTVYRAAGPEGPVALKVVHAHLLATSGFFKRFLREAEIGKRVRHPNVVATLGCDQLVVEGTPRAFLVMEYVEGKSLRDLLRSLGTIPETLLREIALQTAAGLAAIHAAGIVHRDLKPENILITDDHEIRIMDLGVAKLQEASVAITKEGQFAGSMLYAAPEQFWRGEVGPPADLYSLGVVLHELATGENPFRRDNVAAVIGAHVNRVPPRITDTNTGTTTFLAEVVATLLAKKPADRFASAEALHEVLSEAERSKWWQDLAPKLRKEAAYLPRIRVRRETKLHGRAGDLKTLQAAWERAERGEGNTILVDGEAGIGKTRLMDAFVSGLGENEAHVLYGSYPPSGGTSGISDAILGKFGTVDLAGALAPYLTVTPSLVPAFAALVKRESPPTGAEPLRGDALNAVGVHLMRALAEERPLVWIVEDIHFAQRESRDLVLALARAAEGHRVLLLLTARPGVPDDELAHFSRLENFQRMRLARLGARDVMDLIEDAFKSEALAEKLGGKIAKKSDGVPFFIFEMIRGLKEGRFIRQEPDGGYVQTHAIEEIEVPSAVKDLIEGRLRGLTEDQRAILDVGAVQGMSFDPGLVAQVLGEKRVRVLRELAEIERRHGLLRGEAGQTHFDHSQIQEVVYQSLTPDLRSEYHTLLAEAHAGQCGEEPKGEDAVFLAHHHLRGGRPRDALPHLEPAFDHLEKCYRNDTLLDLARRALEAKGLLGGKERVEVLLRQAGRLNLLGRRHDQHAALDEALALADRTGDDALRSRVRRSLGVLHGWTSQYDAAQAVLREALDLAKAAGDAKLEAQAAGNLGNVFVDLGRYAEAREYHERALALFREIENREGEAGATVNLGNAFLGLGRYVEAREHHERGATLCREIGHRLFEANATGNLGNEFHFLGRHAEALEHYERQLALSREIGDRRGEAIATGNLGIVSRCLGQYTEAKQHFARSLALSREIGDRHHEGCALDGLAQIAEAEQDSNASVRLHEEAMTLRRELGDRIAETLVGLGRLKAARGETESAARHLDEALAIARETKSPGTILGAAVERARLPGGDVGAALAALAEHGERVEHTGRMEARFRLWELTGSRAHLEEAHRLLLFMRDHAPEDWRDTMIESAPLHRDIMRAWEKQERRG